jgi:hypothetical protein
MSLPRGQTPRWSLPYGGGLVDDASDIQACDASCILGGLTLGIIEIGGHGDNRFRDRLTEVIFGCRFHFLQHHRGNFRRRIVLRANAHPTVAIDGFDESIGQHALHFAGSGISELGPHQAFGTEESAFRVDNGLSFSLLTDQSLTGFGKGDDRGCRARAFRVRENNDFTLLVQRHAGVGCAEVNTDDSTHSKTSRIGRSTRPKCLFFGR